MPLSDFNGIAVEYAKSIVRSTSEAPCVLVEADVPQSVAVRTIFTDVHRFVCYCFGGIETRKCSVVVFSRVEKVSIHKADV